MKKKLIETLKKKGIIHSQRQILAYWWSGMENKNFGDALNPYLIEKLTGQKPLLCSKRCLREYYAITGSILGQTNKNAIIWGTGIICKDQKIKRPKKILAVRGPLTRKRLIELRYDCPEVYGDPALILPLVYKPKSKKKYELGIIPHYVDYEKVKNEIKDKKILVINLLDPIEKVIEEIHSCKRTASSSLHGIITSQVYDIPTIWIKLSDKLAGDDIKFADYFLSVKLEPYSPLDLREDKLNIPNLVKEIDNFNSKNKPIIDTSKLMEVCPFRKIL